jgi:hypothetical protein
MEIDWANEQNRPKEPVEIVEKLKKDDLDESRFVDM